MAQSTARDDLNRATPQDSFVTPELLDKIRFVESTNQHIDPKTKRLTRSPTGAEGAYQILPSTQKRPGYGVPPVRNRTEVEHRRFAGDYLNALSRKYGDDAKAVVAYNQGPGTVDRAVREAKAAGTTWYAALEKKEGRDYLVKVLGAGAIPTLAVAQASAPAPTPTPDLSRPVTVNPNMRAQVERVREQRAPVQAAPGAVPVDRMSTLTPIQQFGVDNVGAGFQAALGFSMLGASGRGLPTEEEEAGEETAALTAEPTAKQALSSLRGLPTFNAFAANPPKPGGAEPVQMADGGSLDDLGDDVGVVKYTPVGESTESMPVTSQMKLRRPSASKPMGSMGDMSPKPKKEKEDETPKGTARQQLEDLQYKTGLTSIAIKDKLRGLGANTFGAPTLLSSRGKLSRGPLSVASFDKGGDAKKDAKKDPVSEAEGMLATFKKYGEKARDFMVENMISPTDIASGFMGVKKGTALGLLTYSGGLNEGEDAEVAKMREAARQQQQPQHFAWGGQAAGETGAAYGNPTVLAQGDKMRARRALEDVKRVDEQRRDDALTRGRMERYAPVGSPYASDTSGPQTLDEAAGLDPKVDRSTFLPYSKKEGLHVPAVAADLLKLATASDPRYSHLMQPEDAVPLSANLLGGGFGASMATNAAGPGTLGMFLGKAGKTYNPAAEALLLKLEKEGVSPQEIYRITQEKFGHPYGRSPMDQQIKYEISDQGASFTPLANERTVQPDKYGRSSLYAGAPYSRVQDVYHHPELKKAHPDLMKKTFLGLENTPEMSGAAMFDTYNLNTVPTAMDKFVGMFSGSRPGFKRGQKIHVSGPDEGVRKEVLTHELNHFSQNLNKGSEGGSSLGLAREMYPDLMHAGIEERLKPIEFMEFARDLKKQKPEQVKSMPVAALVNQYQEKHVKPLNDALAEYRNLRKQGYSANESSNALIRSADQHVAFAIYNRVSGEAEARLAANRSNLSSKQLGENYPYEPNYFKTATGEDLKDILRGPVARFNGSPEEGERSVGDRLKGYGETAASLLSGLGASIPAGYSGLVELARTRDPEKAAEEIGRRQAAMTYEPRTASGKKSTESAAELLENLNIPAQYVGDKAFEATGDSPLAGAAAQTLLDPLNFIPGAKGLGKLGKKGIQKAIENASMPSDPYFAGAFGRQRGAVKPYGGTFARNSPEFSERSERKTSDYVSNLEQYNQKAREQIKNTGGQFEETTPEHKQAMLDFYNDKAMPYFEQRHGTLKDPVFESLVEGRITLSGGADSPSGFRDYLIKASKRRTAPQSGIRYPADPKAYEDLTQRYDTATGLRPTGYYPHEQNLLETATKNSVDLQQRLAKNPSDTITKHDAEMAERNRIADFIRKQLEKQKEALPPGLQNQNLNPPGWHQMSMTMQKENINPSKVDQLILSDLSTKLSGGLAPFQPKRASIADLERYGALLNELRQRGASTTDPLEIKSLIQQTDEARKQITSDLANAKKLPAYNVSDKMLEAMTFNEPIWDIGSSASTTTGQLNFLSSENLNNYMRTLSPEKIKETPFDKMVEEASKYNADALNADKIISDITMGKSVNPEVFSKGMSAPVKTYEDGFRWVKANDETALKINGASVGHCLKAGAANCSLSGEAGGKGRKSFDSGDTEIYFLQDARGVPMTTVEVINAKDPAKRTISQTKGNGTKTGDTAPVNYDSMVYDLATQLNPVKIIERSTYLSDSMKQLQQTLDTSPSKFRFKRGGVVSAARLLKEMPRTHYVN